MTEPINVVNIPRIQPGSRTSVSEIEGLGKAVLQAHYFEPTSQAVVSVPHDPRVSGCPIHDFENDAEYLVHNTTIAESRVGRGDLSPLTVTTITTMQRDDEIEEALESVADVTRGGSSYNLFALAHSLIMMPHVQDVNTWREMNHEVLDAWPIVAAMCWGAETMSEFRPEDLGPDGGNESWGLYGCWGGLAAGAGSDTVFSQVRPTPLTAHKPVATLDDTKIAGGVRNYVKPYIEIKLKSSSGWRGSNA